jgi:hypothetical protein
MRSIFFLSVLLFITSTSLQAQDNAALKSEVMMNMWKLKTALVAKDSITLSKLLSDDVSYGHTNGMIQTKAQLIRSVVSGEQDYKTVEPSDLNVRVYDNTAVANVKLDIMMNYEGKPLELHMNAVLVWVKKDKDWKLVARQSVNIK